MQNNNTLLHHPLSALSKHIRLSKKPTLTSLMVCSSLLIAGCGDDNDDIFAVNEAEKISDATLIDTPIVTKTFSAAELKAAVAEAGLSAAVDADPVCGITVQYINHTTTGLKGEATNATGAVIVPNSDGANHNDCQGERPILLYAHGTTPVQSYNLAALNDHTNAAYETALLIAANFAGQGDIVIAPNYPGYDKSELKYAPYVTLQQGQQMLDGLHAGKLALEQLATHKAAATDVKAGDKLFITGYSQGGYVAMAAAKALDDKGQPATAVSPASGPYAVTAFADSIMSGNIIYGGTIFLPMLTRSYDNEYGNLTEGVYANKYANTAPNLFPTNDNLLGLFFTGKLPTTELFQSAPTGYEVLDALPAPSPKYAFGFDANNYLFNTEFRAKYVQDMQNNPDGIYPTFKGANGAVPVKSDMAVRKAFIDNDLRAYQPKSPMLLCGGNQDPSVTYDVNADAQARIWQSTAKQPFALIDMDLTNQQARGKIGKSTYVTTLPPSVDNNVRAAATAIQEKFTSNLTTLLTNTYQVAYAKAIGEGKSVAEAQAAGQTASYTEQLTRYHGMIAPYCLSAANVFFDQYR